MIPTLSITFDPAADKFILMATSFNMTAPAGPRLFRGGKPPKMGWEYDTEAEALAEADLLRAYMAEAWGKVRKKKGRPEDRP